MRTLSNGLALWAVAATVAVCPAHAAERSPDAGFADAGLPRSFAAQLPQRRELTLAEAIAIAQMRHPGRVVRAQTIQLGDGAVHEIRIIGNDGVLHVVRVDGRTGKVQ